MARRDAARAGRLPGQPPVPGEADPTDLGVQEWLPPVLIEAEPTDLGVQEWLPLVPAEAEHTDLGVQGWLPTQWAEDMEALSPLTCSEPSKPGKHY